ncbi:MAG TPA: RDD family protein [Mucilaginibacter sp.]|nr:RDD family protein [Mucilaginibacter sp.]
MLNAYYLIEDGQQTGPFSHHELMDKGLRAEDLVFSPINEQWESAASMFEFADYFESQGIYYPSHAILANFWWRLLAYIIDYFILFVSLVVFGTLLSLAMTFTGTHWFESGFGSDTKFEQNVLSVIVLAFYNATFESTRLQGSIGKVVCKLKVVNATGERIEFATALGRNFGKILSSLVCGMGFFCVLWDKNKQGWHDQLAKTYVIRKP